jgi:peptidyl-dipeptidase Dcp
MRPPPPKKVPQGRLNLAQDASCGRRPRPNQPSSTIKQIGPPALHKVNMKLGIQYLITAAAGVIALASSAISAMAADAPFGPGNPFYAPSTLPFQAPPFDKIHDSDYQPAIEAGMAEQMKEIRAMADNPDQPTFENTIVAMEKSGQLLNRVTEVFGAVTSANTNPDLQKVEQTETPKLAAHNDAIYLDEKLYRRVEAIYQQRAALNLDPESLRLVEFCYREFVHAGANLSEAHKHELKKLNQEISTLENDFKNKLLAATRTAAYTTTDKSKLAGLSEVQLGAAAETAKTRKQEGWVLALQNTTQQPLLADLNDRATRQALFEDSWNRAERGGPNDTRATIIRLVQLRADKAKLLGFPNFAAWKLEDQMAKTPEAALRFMDALVPASTANAAGEAKDIQKLMNGGEVEPWDWDFYSKQVRKAKYDIDDAQVRPYFEVNNVLQNGVFYAANQLYGITFQERKDIPVYQADVRVFEVMDVDGKPLALFYCDYFKRDNKNGGAWMSNLVDQSKLLGTLPVIYNVANFSKPAPGQPALISFTDATTMFHEFGHALHGMFADTKYPSLSGTSVARDFVEFPSQFNEHWATYPEIFNHYAKHYKTGAPMPAELVAKLVNAKTFNQGYALTELLAAAELDMQWHTQTPGTHIENSDVFEKEALTRTHLLISYVPPRYRSSYFSHIWSTGYAAGYYAYLWSEMLDDDAYQWFLDHGGLTRANGDRFRRMVLSRGNTEDLAAMYKAWLGSEPTVTPMLKERGLTSTSQSN